MTEGPEGVTRVADNLFLEEQSEIEKYAQAVDDTWGMWLSGNSAFGLSAYMPRLQVT